MLEKGKFNTSKLKSYSSLFKINAIMQKRNYIGDFEVVDDRRGGKCVIKLLGRINKICKKYRYILFTLLIDIVKPAIKSTIAFNNPI